MDSSEQDLFERTMVGVRPLKKRRPIKRLILLRMLQIIQRLSLLKKLTLVFMKSQYHTEKA